MRRTPASLIARAAEAFVRCYGRSPTACGVGPGRVEILGNHTDYNGGCVLTAAIDRHITAVGRPIARAVVRVHSMDLESSDEFGLDASGPERRTGWAGYVEAVFAVLRRAGVKIGGMEVVLCGDVPIGAGLSSSAALEAAVAMLILQFHPHPIDTLELARLLQDGENEFTGVRCGLLDQFSSIHGEEDRVIFLDCSTGAHETLPLGRPAPAIVICDSGVTRELGRDAPYNVRRSECEQAAAVLGRLLGRSVAGLCSVSSAELSVVASGIAEPLLSRARHVVEEHERVLAARDLLRTGPAERFGQLLAESHESSRTLFETSCAALDRLCAAAAGQPGCLGARLCGAGWGGCAVALVVSDAVDSFVEGMRTWWGRSGGSAADIQICYATEGAHGRQL